MTDHEEEWSCWLAIRILNDLSPMYPSHSGYYLKEQFRMEHGEENDVIDSVISFTDVSLDTNCFGSTLRDLLKEGKKKE